MNLVACLCMFRLSDCGIRDRCACAGSDRRYCKTLDMVKPMSNTTCYSDFLLRAVELVAPVGTIAVQISRIPRNRLEHARASPLMPLVRNTYVPTRGPTMPATAKIECSMPIKVPSISFGTMLCVPAVMLVLRENWNKERNSAMPMYVPPLSMDPDRIRASPGANRAASSMYTTPMIATQLRTTTRVSPPSAAVSGARRHPLERPPNAKLPLMTLPIMPSSKPRSFFRISGCAERAMLLAMPVATFTASEKPVTWSTSMARGSQESGVEDEQEEEDEDAGCTAGLFAACLAWVSR
mmetsp:Transcript_56477/g.93340  ORF Transcript_56477/g.93340 Transcript_56477/m.93340 type:complete len:295 (+) Transcript_56477:127-1011(+)